MGSVLWMVGLGLARNIVQRYALETGSEQGFGIGEKVAHDCVDRPDDAAFIECIISEQPAIIPRDIMPPPIVPRPIWPVLVPWSSLPAVPFCAKTGTIRPPRPAASMAMLVSDAHANSPCGEEVSEDRFSTGPRDSARETIVIGAVLFGQHRQT